MNMVHSNAAYIELSNCIRVLAADSVQQAGSGHPGMPLGMADVMSVLTLDFLRYNPNDAKWFNRDRIVLSAGHGCMLLYAFYYLAGYKDVTLDELKRFRQINSKAHGHPEYKSFDAIETTTGPLGQGLGNAVGMAIAAKKYQQFLGYDISDYKIYCIMGDGCLMEGLSYEAASIAGHLCLDNLIILFDNNKISIDGSTDLTVSENHIEKFRSMGWSTYNVNGHSFNEIEARLKKAQHTKKPCFISCDTLIAKGSVNKVNSETAHGSPLGVEEISLLKDNLKMQGDAFFIPHELLNKWRNSWKRNMSVYNEWYNNFAKLPEYKKAYTKPAIINTAFLHQIPIPLESEPTRVSSGKVIERLLQTSNKIICGSADLSLSNNIKNDFSKAITKDDFSGNFIHYGAREHAMGAIMNGLAISGFLPIGGTFFVFSDYMKPAIRLAAMMGLHNIYIMTHDSIGVGEDGPTHQPVEQLAAIRALPGINVLRPADCVETIESWNVALLDNAKPHMIVLTRQKTPQLRQAIDIQTTTMRGAYKIFEPHKHTIPDVNIFATGSELQIAIEASKMLATHKINAHVTSVVCFELLFKQDDEYIKSILSNAKLHVAIEAASMFGWHRIIGKDGIFFGIDEFGISAPEKMVYQHFGISAENISAKIRAYLDK